MEKFRTRLLERTKKGSERSLSLFPGFVDFYSNDYLGLSQGIAAPELHTGSTGSRLLSGNSEQAEETEAFLSGFFGSEASLVFNSGYDANLGVFSSLPQRGDTVLYDELIHASVRDGIRLSHARAHAFRHNDLNDLEQKITRAEGTVFVAVESLYSMDGDLAPLAEIAGLCTKLGALLIVDEAHSGGVFGEQGRGLCHELGITAQVFARVVTFGKAYGTHGATVLSSAAVKAYLINFARSFIYTTALPPYQYMVIRSQVERAMEDGNRQKLLGNIGHCRKILHGKLSLSDPRSPIQIMLVPGITEAKRIARALQEDRLAVKAILSPTVAEGQERLRICLHAFNEKEEVERLKLVSGNR